MRPEGDLLQFVPTVEDLLGRGYPVRFRVEGLSMRPTIQSGETITVAPLGQTPVRTGDVLLYRRDRAAIVHRVVHVRASGRPMELVLRGDATECCDAPIVLDQVLGRVVTVERAGRTMRLASPSDRWFRALRRGMRRARALPTKVAGVIGRSVAGRPTHPKPTASEQL